SNEPVVYAVPGHPAVAEATTGLLKERCAAAGVELSITGGESCLDQAFLRLGFDPVEGFQLLDAASLDAALLQPWLHTVIAQIYDGFTASDVKLALMELYAPEHEIVIAQSLGVSGKEAIRTIPLVELDRLREYGNHMLVWVPASPDDKLRIRSFERLHEIVRI